MARHLAESLADWKMSALGLAAWLISGLILLLEGLRHITSPSEALFAHLLDMVGVTVGSELALTAPGLLALASMLVGVLVLLNGVYLLYGFGKGILKILG